jgi:hypothetical protein
MFDSVALIVNVRLCYIFRPKGWIVSIYHVSLFHQKFLEFLLCFNHVFLFHLACTS